MLHYGTKDATGLTFERFDEETDHVCFVTIRGEQDTQNLEKGTSAIGFRNLVRLLQVPFAQTTSIDR